MRLFSVKEVADFLDISGSAVRAAISKRRIKADKCGNQWVVLDEELFQWKTKICRSGARRLRKIEKNIQKGLRQ